MGTVTVVIAVAAAASLAGCAWAVGRRRVTDLSGSSSAQSVPERSRPIGFGYNTQWLSIRSANTDEVVRALKLVDARRADWEEGIAAAKGDEVFVGPPVEGWTLVVWSSLPSFGESTEALRQLLVRVSALLGTEVQYFGTHRVVEYHAWARAIPGELRRAYAHLGESGETLIDEGEQTPEEKALGFRFFDDRSPGASDDAYWERDDLTWPDEACVIQLAERWSIDPTRLDERGLDTGLGWIGRPSE